MGENKNENRKGKDEEADHSKKDDKEACLEEYKKFIDAKTALRQNANYLRTLDSSIKRNTAVIKKLKMINDERKDDLMEELKKANLSNFISGAVSYLCEAKPRSADIHAAVQICSLLHQRYKDFSPCLIQGLSRLFFPGESGDDFDSDKNSRTRKRSTLKLLIELYFIGIIEDASTFTNIIKELTALEHLKDRETTQTNLSLLSSFAREGKKFLGLQEQRQGVYDEQFFTSLSITADEKQFFKKAFNFLL